jgi:hypothetical protein
MIVEMISIRELTPLKTYRCQVSGKSEYPFPAPHLTGLTMYPRSSASRTTSSISLFLQIAALPISQVKSRDDRVISTKCTATPPGFNTEREFMMNLCPRETAVINPEID